MKSRSNMKTLDYISRAKNTYRPVIPGLESRAGMSYFQNYVT